MALFTMPTCGPFPWATTTSQPSSMRSTIALAVILTVRHLFRQGVPERIAAKRDYNSFFFAIG